ncbi:MAG: ABC transporter permease [Bilophila wadsworthia]
MPECCGSGPRGAVAWKLVKSFRKPCRDVALEEAHPPLPPSADPVHLLELGNIQRPCSGISSAVAEDGLGNGVAWARYRKGMRMPAGRFWGDLSASLGRVGSGYLLAVIPGVALGLASGRSPALASLLSPIINGVRAVPGISWLPLALLWLGIGFRATVFLIALAGFFPAYLNAAAGAAAVPPVLIRAGRMLGFGRRAIFFRVVIPSAMPQVRTGLRVALGMSFSYLVLGELTGVPDGLGAMIMDARLAGRVDLLVSGIILIALVGWLCDVLLMRALSAVSVSLRRQ